MIDTLLSFFSVNHDLYNKLKLKPPAMLDLDDKESIHMEDVFQFHRLQIEPTHLYNRMYAKCAVSHFKSSTEDHDKLAAVFNPIIKMPLRNANIQPPKYSIDISELSGFSNSKSSLTDYKTMDDFVEQRCPSYVDSITHERLAEMLKHDEIRIVNSPETTSDEFYVYGWAPKLFLSNAGGSHHLAAAQYLSKRLNEPVALEARINTYTISLHDLNIFDSQYEAFILPNSELNDLIHAFDIADIKFIKVHVIPDGPDLYFFEKNSKNKRIISLFEQRYTSLNKELFKREEFQSINPVLASVNEFLDNTVGSLKFALGSDTQPVKV
ncbi:TPA: hypothetical protein MW242_003092 [Acinetobacter baumannii]|nr:hypothetical protein [Acinetobacter baumannii]